MKAILRSLLLLAVFAASSLSADKPNIIFIMADDLGYGDVACYNPESKVATPHMDKLAAGGMHFTDAPIHRGFDESRLFLKRPCGKGRNPQTNSRAAARYPSPYIFLSCADF